jgi:hypothetical protein
MMQDLIDKVLFPQVAIEDTRIEKEFYKKRGIPSKLGDSALVADIQVRVKDGTPITHKRKRPQAQCTKEEVMFELHPETDLSSSDTGLGNMPSLQFPLIRTESSLRVGQLKKYLLLKLDLPNGVVVPNLEILCHGVPLGDELSIAFAIRTVWMETAKQLELTYRYAVYE